MSGEPVTVARKRVSPKKRQTTPVAKIEAAPSSFSGVAADPVLVISTPPAGSAAVVPVNPLRPQVLEFLEKPLVESTLGPVKAEMSDFAKAKIEEYKTKIQKACENDKLKSDAALLLALTKIQQELKKEEEEEQAKGKALLKKLLDEKQYTISADSREGALAAAKEYSHAIIFIGTPSTILAYEREPQQFVEIKQDSALCKLWSTGFDAREAKTRAAAQAEIDSGECIKVDEKFVAWKKEFAQIIESSIKANEGANLLEQLGVHEFKYSQIYQRQAQSSSQQQDVLNELKKACQDYMNQTIDLNSLLLALLKERAKIPFNDGGNQLRNIVTEFIDKVLPAEKKPFHDILTQLEGYEKERIETDGEETYQGNRESNSKKQVSTLRDVVFHAWESGKQNDSSILLNRVAECRSAAAAKAKAGTVSGRSGKVFIYDDEKVSRVWKIADDYIQTNASEKQKHLLGLLHALDVYEKERWFISGVRKEQIQAIRLAVQDYLASITGKPTLEETISTLARIKSGVSQNAKIVDKNGKKEFDSEIWQALNLALNELSKGNPLQEAVLARLHELNVYDKERNKPVLFGEDYRAPDVKSLTEALGKALATNQLKEISQADAQVMKKIEANKRDGSSRLYQSIRNAQQTRQKELVAILESDQPSFDGTIFQGLSAREDIEAVLGKECSSNLSDKILAYRDTQIKEGQAVEPFVEQIIAFNLLSGQIPEIERTRHEIDVFYRAKVQVHLGVKESFPIVVQAIREFSEKSTITSSKLEMLIGRIHHEMASQIGTNPKIESVLFFTNLVKELQKILPDQSLIFSDFYYSMLKEEIKSALVFPLNEITLDKIEQLQNATLDGSKLSFSDDEKSKLKEEMKAKAFAQLSQLLDSSPAEFNQVVEAHPSKQQAQGIVFTNSFRKIEIKELLEDFAREAVAGFITENQATLEEKGKKIVKEKLTKGDYAGINAFIANGYVFKVLEKEYCNTSAIQAVIVNFVKAKEENKVDDDKYLGIVDAFKDLKEQLAAAYASPKYQEICEAVDQKAITLQRLGELSRFDERFFTVDQITDLQHRIQLRSAQVKVLGILKTAKPAPADISAQELAILEKLSDADKSELGQAVKECIANLLLDVTLNSLPNYVELLAKIAEVDVIKELLAVIEQAVTNSIVSSSVKFKNALTLLVQFQIEGITHLNQMYQQYVGALKNKNYNEVGCLRKLIEIVSKSLPDLYPAELITLIDLLHSDHGWEKVNSSDFDITKFTATLEKAIQIPVLKELIKNAVVACYESSLSPNAARLLTQKESTFILVLAEKVGITEILQAKIKQLVNQEGEIQLCQFNNALMFIVSSDMKTFSDCKDKLLAVFKTALEKEPDEYTNNETVEHAQFENVFRIVLALAGEDEIKALLDTFFAKAFKLLYLPDSEAKEKIFVEYVEKLFKSIKLIKPECCPDFGTLCDFLIEDKNWEGSQGKSWAAGLNSDNKEKLINIAKSLSPEVKLIVAQLLKNRCEKFLSEGGVLGESLVSFVVQLIRILEIKEKEIEDAVSAKAHEVVYELFKAIRKDNLTGNESHQCEYSFKNAIALICQLEGKEVLKIYGDNLYELYVLGEKGKGTTLQNLRSALVTSNQIFYNVSDYRELVKLIECDQGWEVDSHPIAALMEKIQTPGFFDGLGPATKVILKDAFERRYQKAWQERKTGSIEALIPLGKVLKADVVTLAKDFIGAAINKQPQTDEEMAHLILLFEIALKAIVDMKDEAGLKACKAVLEKIPEKLELECSLQGDQNTQNSATIVAYVGGLEIALRKILPKEWCKIQVDEEVGEASKLLDKIFAALNDDMKWAEFVSKDHNNFELLKKYSSAGSRSLEAPFYDQCAKLLDSKNTEPSEKEIELIVLLGKALGLNIGSMLLNVMEEEKNANEPSVRFMRALEILIKSGDKDALTDCVERCVEFKLQAIRGSNLAAIAYAQAITQKLPYPANKLPGIITLLRNDKAWEKEDVDPLLILGFKGENPETEFAQLLRQFDSNEKALLMSGLSTRYENLTQKYKERREGKAPTAVDDGRTPYPLKGQEVISTKAWQFMGLLNRELGAPLDSNNVVYRAMNAVRQLTAQQEKINGNPASLVKWFKNALAVVIASGNEALIAECQLHLKALCYRYEKLSSSQKVIGAGAYTLSLIRALAETTVNKDAALKAEVNKSSPNLKEYSNLGSEGEAAEKYLTLLRTSHKAIWEIKELFKDSKEINSNLRRYCKQLYLWRHHVLMDNFDFVPAVPNSMKALYAPIIENLKAYKNNTLSLDECNHKIVESYESIQAENVKKVLKTNMDVMLSDKNIQQATENLKVAIKWFRDGDVNARHKADCAEVLLRYKNSRIEEINDVDMFDDGISPLMSLETLLEKEFAKCQSLEYFFIESLVSAERPNTNISDVLGTTDERQIASHFSFVSKIFSELPREQQQKLLPAQSKGEYGQKLEKALWLGALQSSVNVLKERSGDEIPNSVFDKSVNLLKASHPKEVSRMLLGLMTRLNERLDGEYTDIWSENKITLKKKIEQAVLSDENLSKAYLEVIQDECRSKTVKEVVGADDLSSKGPAIVGEYFVFIKRLLDSPVNQDFNKSLLNSEEGKTFGEFGKRLVAEMKGEHTASRRKTVNELAGVSIKW